MQFKRMLRYRIGLSLALLLSAACGSAAETRSNLRGPVAPTDSLQQFSLHPDCRIELVAAEPDVVDPVHVSFDERGRMWVVEYSDYPNGPVEGQPGLSRIRVLTDDDGDGRYGNSRLFADRLLFATGLLPWRDGVIVTTAGSVLFLRDTDDDGRSDAVEEWFTGFKTDNPQLRANHPTLSLNNHIYIASGLRGGEVGPGRDWAEAFGRDSSELPAAVSLSGRDFRFHPLTGDFEAVSGPGQFGLTFNDAGDRFVCDNRHPCKQIVFEEQHLRRNPKFSIPQVAVDVLPAGEDSRLFPLSRAWTTSNLHANQFTAACGLHLYRGSALPGEMYGNVFVCDPTANLVHRAVTTPQGPVQTSQRGREGVEFLATADEWFRPVNLTTGPDGALYVVDMYRAVIEHPQFMPEELKERPDLWLGNDRGRIYRVTAASRDSNAVGGPAAKPLSTELPAICHLLGDPNSWQRETAHRLLLQSDAPTAQTDLAELIGNPENAFSSIHALWLLHAKGALSLEQLKSALRNTQPAVQRQAMLIAAERRDGDPAVAELTAKAARLTDDPALRFTAALCLPDLPGMNPARDLLPLLVQNRGDSWTAQAAATAPPEMVLAVLAAAANESSAPGLLNKQTFAPLFEVAGASATTGELSLLLERSTSPEQLTSLATGMRRRGKRLADVMPELSDGARQGLEKWFERAREIVLGDASAAEKRNALTALAHAPWETSSGTILEVIQGRDESQVRAAAIDVAGQFRSEDLGRLLVDDFTGQPPDVRAAMIRAMTVSPVRIALLLDEVEAGRIPGPMIDAATVKRLTSSGDQQLRDRASSIFASLTPESRRKVLEEYQSCLTLDAEPQRGREVFKAHCITCHRIGELGVNVAPDISDSRTKTREYLLTAILDPNQAIDNNYFSYTVIDREGLVHTGVLATETATSITLKQPEGKTITLSRDQIEEFRSNGVSLMPEGLERNINPQQLADLISFIKNWRYLDGSVPREVIR